MRFHKLCVTLGALALVLVLAPASHAQLNSNVATVNLNAVLGETLTVSAAYFSTGNALTDGAGNNIPTANVDGSVNSGPAGAFTGATPFGANGMTVFSQALGVGTYNDNRADTIDLTIDTTGLGLPSATDLPPVFGPVIM